MKKTLVTKFLEDGIPDGGTQEFFDLADKVASENDIDWYEEVWAEETDYQDTYEFAFTDTRE